MKYAVWFARVLFATWMILLVPAIILHARRLHDMGHTAWLLLAPGVLMLVALAIWLRLVSFGAQLDAIVPPIALVVWAGFAVWGLLGKGQGRDAEIVLADT
jgi:uncharacterized membrane protein YhaH (DUF805 family)